MLIIANSGRMLAQAACDAGFNVVVIDCFADKDTKILVQNLYQVKSLAIKDIQIIVESLKGEFKHCLYGSGFESHQESLYFLAEHFQLFGNLPCVFAALHDKHDFFQRLQQLDICFPRIYFNMPTTGGYLRKPFDSQGGLNIQKTPNLEAIESSRYYYQQYLNGQTLSVLFVANNKQAAIIGFNQQWTIALSHQQPFIFSGIINHAELSVHHQQTLKKWVDKLTHSYGLRGLCSLDFIYYKNVCYILEINPRPPASMQLYAKEFDLFTLHLKNCGADFVKPKKIQRLYNYIAYQIIYAPMKIKIPKMMKWQDYCCDLPVSNTIIHKGEAICSIIISGTNPARMYEDLRYKQHNLLQQLSK